MNCPYCNSRMKIVDVEDDDYENPFGGGWIFYQCSKCGSSSTSEKYGFGKGTKASAGIRLKERLSKRRK